jgi:hypothetical protein
VLSQLVVSWLGFTLAKVLIEKKTIFCLCISGLSIGKMAKLNLSDYRCPSPVLSPFTHNSTVGNNNFRPALNDVPKTIKSFRLTSL